MYFFDPSYRSGTGWQVSSREAVQLNDAQVGLWSIVPGSKIGKSSNWSSEAAYASVTAELPALRNSQEQQRIHAADDAVILEIS
jgi:hypothetical protein